MQRLLHLEAEWAPVGGGRPSRRVLVFCRLSTSRPLRQALRYFETLYAGRRVGLLLAVRGKDGRLTAVVLFGMNFRQPWLSACVRV